MVVFSRDVNYSGLTAGHDPIRVRKSGVRPGQPMVEPKILPTIIVKAMTEAPPSTTRSIGRVGLTPPVFALTNPNIASANTVTIITINTRESLPVAAAVISGREAPTAKDSSELIAA